MILHHVNMFIVEDIISQHLSGPFDQIGSHENLSSNARTAVTGVGSSPALATCETSQSLVAGVSCGFSRGSPVFAPPTDWPVTYELK